MQWPPSPLALAPGVPYDVVAEMDEVSRSSIRCLPVTGAAPATPPTPANRPLHWDAGQCEKVASTWPVLHNGGGGGGNLHDCRCTHTPTPVPRVHAGQPSHGKL